MNDLAIAEIYLGHPDQAVALWSSVVQRWEAAPEALPYGQLAAGNAYCSLGTYYFRTKDDPAAALGCFQKSLKLVPRNLNAIISSAQVLIIQGRLKDAHAVLQSAVHMYPNSQVLWTNIGDVYRYARQPKNALMAYNHALEVDSGYLPAHTGLAVAKGMAGDTREAEQMLDRLLGQNRRSPEVLTATGVLLLQEKQTETAIRLFQAARQVEPDYFEVRYQMQLLALPVTRPAAAASRPQG
jgi:tetratricopeptide (TPR) repeat protein